MSKSERKDSSKNVLGIFLASGVFVLSSAISYFYYNNNISYYNHQLDSIDKTALHLEKIDNTVNKIYNLNDSDFTELQLQQLLVDVNLKKYNLSPQINNSWEANKKLISEILLEKNNLLDLKNNIEKSNLNYESLIDNIISLQKNLLTYNNYKYNKIGQDLLIIANSLSNIDKQLYGDNNISIENNYLLIKNLKTINFYLNVLLTGSNLLEIAPITNSKTIDLIKTTQLSFYPYTNLINKINENLEPLKKVKNYSKKLSDNISVIEKNLEKVDKEINEKITNLDYVYYIMLVSFLGLIICLLLLTKRFYSNRNIYTNYKEVNDKYQNNKVAVKNLVYALEPLKSSDLTKEIKITDKFLENIAKIFDSTRRTLVDIIKGLLHESNKIHTTSNEINTLSRSILNDFNNQKNVISNSIDQFTQITSSLEDISQNTYFTAEDAKQSVSLATNGLNTVNQSIEKMNEIRNNIQESSKRIKKLGESAQGVVEVTSVIRGITKEINLLAFNAAIEAATANSKGNSFSVMANEVQRLALLSSTASKDIDNKIKEILEDAGQAVSAMEETTQQIVDGTVLNEQAVKILNNLSTFSEKISENVSSIADKIDEKSDEMVELSVVFRDIQKMNNDNTIKVNQSREKLNNIQQSAENLTELVSRFKINNY